VTDLLPALHHVIGLWINAINTTYAGIWRAIPSTGPDLRLGGPDDPLVQEIAKQARLLQASRVSYRKRDTLYEAYIPDGTRFGGRSLPPIRGLSPEASRRANLLLGRGSSMRVQPGRDEEFDQLHTDYFAVWDRSLMRLRENPQPRSSFPTSLTDHQ